MRMSEWPRMSRTSIRLAPDSTILVAASWRRSCLLKSVMPARFMSVRKLRRSHLYGFPVRGLKNRYSVFFFFGSSNETGNYFVSNFIQRNLAGFFTFRFSEKDSPFLEINLLDLQV